MVFESKPEEREWLKKWLVGLLRKDFRWEESREEMQGKWVPRSKLFIWGTTLC